MKRLANWISSFVILSSIISTAAAQQQSLSAKSLLSQMTQSLKELSYDASFVYMHGNKIEAMRILHSMENGRERERLIHLDGPPREVIRDGGLVTCLLADNDPFIIDSNNQQSLIPQPNFSDIAELEKYYTFSIGQPSRVAGLKANMVSVTAKDTYRYSYRLWLDEATGFLLRSDVIDSKEQLVEQILVVSLTLGPVTQDELFAGNNFDTVSLHNSLQSKKQRALAANPSSVIDNTDWQIEWLPDGFHLAMQELRHAKTTSENHQSVYPVQYFMYSDGLSSISVYIQQHDDEAKRSSEIVRKGSMTVYDMPKSDFQVTVVGDVPLMTVERIAASVAASNKNNNAE